MPSAAPGAGAGRSRMPRVTMSFPAGSTTRISSTWARAAERRGAGPVERNTVGSTLIQRRVSAEQMQRTGTIRFAARQRRDSSRRTTAKEVTARTAQKDGSSKYVS